MERQRIVLPLDYLNALAGKEIPRETCIKILQALEYEVES
jgi:phenylalanyl-tRNA synthetase beta subunit